MPGLKIIFGQQIYLNWDHYLLRIKVLNIYFMCDRYFHQICMSQTSRKKKRKNAKALFNAFIKVVNASNRRSNKIRVDQGREFYKSPMQNS